MAPAKKKRGRGRPPLPKRERKSSMINFKLTDGERPSLDKLARALRLSRSDTIREALKRLHATVR